MIGNLRIIVAILALSTGVLGCQTTGGGSPALDTASRQSATLYRQNKFAEAAPFADFAARLGKKSYGTSDPKYADLLTHAGVVYRALGRYGRAINYEQRALAVREKIHGPDHKDVGSSLNQIALLYRAQGLYFKALPIERRALAISEKVLGPDHPAVARSLNSIALGYRVRGRYADAIPFQKRALKIQEKALGKEHADVGASLSNLAIVYKAMGRIDDAQMLQERALTIAEKAFGKKHLNVATILNNLAMVYLAQGKHEKVETLSKRTLAIWEEVGGPFHPNVAASLNNLAALYQSQGRFADAETQQERSLNILMRTFGPEHPKVATSLGNLATLNVNQKRFGKAIVQICKASVIYRKIAARAGQSSGAQWARPKAIQRPPVYERHVWLAWRVAAGRRLEDTPLLGETFVAGQLARTSDAADAVARMAARFAPGTGALAQAVRERQDAVEAWQRSDSALIKELAKPPNQRDEKDEARLRAKRDAAAVALGKLDERLATEFPNYAELVRPKPVTIPELGKLLAPREALIAYLSGNQETYLWVARRDGARMYRSSMDSRSLKSAVVKLRAALDPETELTSLADIPPFDRKTAYELYKQIFAPAEEMLGDVDHIYIVPDGPLQSLPMGVLVTEEPKDTSTDFEVYRTTSWLATKYALTVLPSVSSLRALNKFARSSAAIYPFVGFGDPALAGAEGDVRGVKMTKLFTRGAVADVNVVRNLPLLPDTAKELRAIAKITNAGEGSVFLREQATETRVRQMNLAQYRVISFATHGLIAGDLKDLVEPALVLTPPKKGTALDDGLLTASEVAQLKLDADWVIMSACNTAAADGTPGAKGLSGLAKAFFYAGSRALLVSHWPVESSAAVRLTTGIFQSILDAPSIGRAEALKRSMLGLMKDEQNSFYAHPMFWAPFVVVGKGGTNVAQKSASSAQVIQN